jgi:hypothetical protein
MEAQTDPNYRQGGYSFHVNHSSADVGRQVVTVRRVATETGPVDHHSPRLDPRFAAVSRNEADRVAADIRHMSSCRRSRGANAGPSGSSFSIKSRPMDQDRGPNSEL